MSNLFVHPASILLVTSSLFRFLHCCCLIAPDVWIRRAHNETDKGLKPLMLSTKGVVGFSYLDHKKQGLGFSSGVAAQS